MRKISISSQIIILFIMIILASSSIFTALTLSIIRVVAEEETHSRLVTFTTLVDLETEDSNVDFRDMQIEFVRKYDDQLFSSPNINKFISQNDINTIIEKSSINKDINIYTDKIINQYGDTIYYAIRFYSDTNDYSLLITDSSYVRNMVQHVSLQLVLMFMIITSAGTICIGAWSNRFASRLHLIQNHILDLPKNGYEESYADSGLDEIGELSRAVESMRIEIKESESSKREMLQNISHDFKTPIAVIKSYAEAQQDGMADEDSSKIIIAQAEILKHKVNRLLQYNSLEYLKKDREFEDVNMKEVITEVIQGYKFQTNINIELDLDENIYFKGYRENYYTVVDNIIDNAKRYAKSYIKIVLKKERLRIFNDGEHIDEQFIKNAFKPYEKGSNGEFGLGMSIVKKTVEFFGMNLFVVNEQVGVSFIITTQNKN